MFPLFPVYINQLKWAMEKLTLKSCMTPDFIAMCLFSSFKKEVLLNCIYDLQQPEIRSNHFHDVWEYDIIQKRYLCFRLEGENCFLYCAYGLSMVNSKHICLCNQYKKIKKMKIQISHLQVFFKLMLLSNNSRFSSVCVVLGSFWHGFICSL